MSRHIIEALDPERHEVTIGYDRPLNNFFAQVHDLTPPADCADDDERDDLVLWVFGESTPEAVAHQLTGYARVSYEMLMTLRSEQDNSAHHPMSLLVDHRRAAHALTPSLNPF